MKITETILQKEVNVKLVNNTGSLTSEYPDLVICEMSPIIFRFIHTDDRGRPGSLPLS
jgi:hypothetical protein